LKRDGVRLAHFEAAPKAPQSPPLVLVNGWTGNTNCGTARAERSRGSFVLMVAGELPWQVERAVILSGK
jgi:hypothetical protein